MSYNYVVVTFTKGPTGVCDAEVYSLEGTYQEALAAMEEAYYGYNHVVQIHRIDTKADQLGGF